MMATTTLMPLDPALSPQRVSRLLTISASLLPEEIVAGRRARLARTVVLVALLVVVALLAGWYAYASQQVRLANHELAGITTETRVLQKSQTQYGEVVGVQNNTAMISKQLRTLLADDLPWATMLKRLRDIGSESGVSVRGVVGTLGSGTAGARATATDTLPSGSDAHTIGRLTITGTAPDKPSVAGYVDALGHLPALANPYLTNASQSTNDVMFSVNVDITDKALCGRFTAKCTTGGGN
jgi:hypothetical protein